MNKMHHDIWTHWLVIKNTTFKFGKYGEYGWNGVFCEPETTHVISN